MSGRKSGRPRRHTPVKRAGAERWNSFTELRFMRHWPDKWALCKPLGGLHRKGATTELDWSRQSTGAKPRLNEKPAPAVDSRSIASFMSIASFIDRPICLVETGLAKASVEGKRYAKASATRRRHKRGREDTS